MPQSPTDWPSVIYHWRYRWNRSVGKVLVKFFFSCASLVLQTVGVWFFFPIEVATEKKITDDQYFDRRVPSLKILLTNCVLYIDGMNPPVKLFNGVVFKQSYKYLLLIDHADSIDGIVIN